MPGSSRGGLQCIKALISMRDERTLLRVLDLVDKLDTDEGKRAFVAPLPGPGWPQAAVDRVRELRL